MWEGKSQFLDWGRVGFAVVMFLPFIKRYRYYLVGHVVLLMERGGDGFAEFMLGKLRLGT